jgi:DNA polymerase
VSVLDSPSPLSFAELEQVALACTRCELATTRTQVVFGVGDPHADLMFVGEGPGEQEDLRGEPFVGRAGGLLTSLIEGIGLTREQVYIANVVKCRPPGNRDPLPVEIERCRPYLDAQLAHVDPAVVVTLGNFATKLLLATKDGITKLRGQEFPFGGGPTEREKVLIPVFHPAAVLRNGGRALAEARADFVTVKRALARARA